MRRPFMCRLGDHPPERQDKAGSVPQSKQCVDTVSSSSGSAAAFIKWSKERTPSTIISSSNQFKDKFCTVCL